jgi:hypothetical protein
MAEYLPIQEQRTEGYFPNTGNTIIELYRLLAIFLASKNFAKLCKNYPGEGFDPIHKIQEVEEDEITRILLSLAITARVVDDRENIVFEQVSAGCGTIQKDILSEEVETLDLREACNKIIHAKSVKYDVEELNVQIYLNPFIYLYGSFQGKQWRVNLDIIKFCKEYVSIVCRF